MEAKDANSHYEIGKHLDTSRGISTSDDLSELSTGTSEVEETQATSGTVSDSEENIAITTEHNDQFSNSVRSESEVAPSDDSCNNSQSAVFQNGEDFLDFTNNATPEAVGEKNELSPYNGSIHEGFINDDNNSEFDDLQNSKTSFEFKEEGQNDDFDEFGDFDGPGDLSNADDDFGDFGDFDEVSEVKNPIETQPLDIQIDGIDNYVSSLVQCRPCHRRHLLSAY